MAYVNYNFCRRKTLICSTCELTVKIYKTLTVSLSKVSQTLPQPISLSSGPRVWLISSKSVRISFINFSLLKQMQDHAILNKQAVAFTRVEHSIAT